MNTNFDDYLFVFHATEENKNLINEKIKISNLQKC